MQTTSDLIDWIAGLLPGYTVLQGVQNNMAQPSGTRDVIMVTPLRDVRTDRRRMEYSEDSTTVTSRTGFLSSWQVDCHGPGARAAAMTIDTAWVTMAACYDLQGIGSGLQPVSATDPVTLPYTTGENQQEWRVTQELQGFQTISATQATPGGFDAVTDMTFNEVTTA